MGVQRESRERGSTQCICVYCMCMVGTSCITSAMLSQTTLDQNTSSQITFSQISYKSHLDKPHSANHSAKSHSVKSRTAYLGLSTCVLFLQPTTFNRITSSQITPNLNHIQLNLTVSNQLTSSYTPNLIHTHSSKSHSARSQPVKSRLTEHIFCMSRCLGVGVYETRHFFQRRETT